MDSELKKSLLFIAFLLALLIFDWIFMPKRSRAAWAALAVLFGMAALASIFTGVAYRISDTLGFGRPVDIVLYFTTVILIRELFLSRQRQFFLQEELTRLARHIAHKEAERVGD